MRDWVADAVRGKLWWPRAALLLALLWILRGYVGDPLHSSIFFGVTLSFHEMGHVVFSWLGGRMLATVGGTVFQLCVPLVAGAYLLVKQRDPFGAAVCIFWLGTALFDAGVYAADARAQALPLVSPFGPIDVDSHDWTVMLLRVGMISRDQAIGSFLRSSGILTMGFSIAAGAWVLRVMATEAKGVASDR